MDPSNEWIFTVDGAINLNAVDFILIGAYNYVSYKEGVVNFFRFGGREYREDDQTSEYKKIAAFLTQRGWKGTPLLIYKMD